MRRRFGALFGKYGGYFRGFAGGFRGIFRKPGSLAATCAVFGESELIGKIIEGLKLPALAAGVNYSVVRRLLPLLQRHLPAPEVFFSGGVANNRAIALLLERELGQKVSVLPNPHFNGAIGCCFYALKEAGLIK